jgi:hypothetical protein
VRRTWTTQNVQKDPFFTKEAADFFGGILGGVAKLLFLALVILGVVGRSVGTLLAIVKFMWQHS